MINSNIERQRTSGIYSWFTEKVIDDVTNDLIKRYNLSKEGALMMINKGGLNIYSTMDINIQEAVENTFESYIAYLKPQNGKYPEASCVVLDPYTSDILGIAGGVGGGLFAAAFQIEHILAPAEGEAVLHLLTLLQHPALSKGDFYGLNWANMQTPGFRNGVYAFLRHYRKTKSTLLVGCNLSAEKAMETRIHIPQNAMDWAGMKTGSYCFVPLLETASAIVGIDSEEVLTAGVPVSLPPGRAHIFEWC